MKLTIVAILFITFLQGTGVSQSVSPKSYIGYEYSGVIPGQKLPNGIQNLGGV